MPSGVYILRAGGGILEDNLGMAIDSVRAGCGTMALWNLVMDAVLIGRSVLFDRCGERLSRLLAGD